MLSDSRGMVNVRREGTDFEQRIITYYTVGVLFAILNFNCINWVKAMIYKKALSTNINS